MKIQLVFVLSALILAVEGGCPSGWSPYKAHCYQWFAGLHTDYESAVHVCERANAKMLTINSESEHDFITDHFSHIDDNIWFDADNSSFDNWNVTKPALKDEICAAIRFEPRGHPIWIHSKCHYFNDVVCKAAKKHERDSFCEMVDEFEDRYHCCGSPTPSPVPTSTFAPYTRSTFSPTTGPITTRKPGNCEAGWREYNNKCYKYFCESLTQGQAFIKCSKLAAFLPSIHSKSDEDFLLDIGQECNDPSNDFIWTCGVIVETSPIRYEWLDGSANNYTNFRSGKLPQDPNLRGLEFCKKEGNWWNYDTYDNLKMSVLCVKDL